MLLTKAMIKMSLNSSPLEEASDTIKDLFYSSSNRKVLDFVSKCWRPNESFRPSAKLLLENPFITKRNSSAAFMSESN